MDYNPSIFKAYDIRGLVDKDFDDEFAERLGRAFVVHTGAKVVVAGRDMRGSSPGYFKALTEGMMKQGADVIDIGMVSTPMFYFAVSEYELHDAGIMVTASHNPSEYNGFKMVHGDAMPIGGDTGMKEIKALVDGGAFPEAQEGTLIETDIVEDYLERLFELVPPEDIKGLKVAVDAGNGMSGVILPEIFRRLDVKAFPLYWEPDGTFPNHEANPLKTETLKDLQAKIRQTKADIGVAFDGDSDRIGLVDERGEIIRADQIIAMMARMLLKENPGRKVTYNVSCGLVAPEEIKANGGEPIMTPTGHAVIKPILRKEEALFGGELSGHFYFEEFGGAENTDYVMLLFLRLLSLEKEPLSVLAAPVRRYFHSGEINFHVADKQGKIDAVLAKYGAKAMKTTIDGIRLDFEDWWLGVRASNTEPLLRLNLEAKTEELMEAKKAELSALLSS
jgi:phosphomannomutase